MYKDQLINEGLCLFDFRGLDLDEEIAEQKRRVLSWQLRRQIRRNLQERIISAQHEKNKIRHEKTKNSIWERVRGRMPNSTMLYTLLGLDDEDVLQVQHSFLEDQRTAIYGCAVVHETQQSLREWLLREIPDLLVISTNKEAGPLTGHCPSLNRLSAEKSNIKD